MNFASQSFSKSPGDRELFRSQFLKTRPCRFFQAGRCRRGSGCTFAHGTVQCPPDLTKTSLCKRWSEGHCNLSGKDCPFAHGHSELRRSALYRSAALRNGYSKNERKDSQDSSPTSQSPTDFCESEPEDVGSPVGSVSSEWLELEDPAYIYSPLAPGSPYPQASLKDPSSEILHIPPDFFMCDPYVPSWCHKSQNVHEMEPMTVYDTKADMQPMNVNPTWSSFGTDFSHGSSLGCLMQMPEIVERDLLTHLMAC